ncbi:MAG: hypothetical protein OHK0017_10280 [Patescibacteria group bacterium]
MQNPPQGSLLRSLTQFISKPNTNSINISAKQKFFWVLKLIGAQVLLATMAGLVVNLILDKIKYNGSHLVEEALYNESIWVFILQASILAPIMEEIAFRLWLRFTSVKLAISTFFLSFYILQTIGAIFLIQFTNSFSELDLATRILILYGSVIIIAGLLAVMVFVLSRLPKIKQLLSEVFNDNIREFYYLSSILFALLHVTNFTSVTEIWWLTPLLILPQLIFGLGLGFIRIKFGFRWSVLSHSLINTLVVIPYIFVTFGSNSLIEVIKNAENLKQQTIDNLTQLDKILLVLTEFSFYAILCFELFCLISLITDFIRFKKPIN